MLISSEAKYRWGMVTKYVCSALRADCKEPVIL